MAASATCRLFLPHLQNTLFCSLYGNVQVCENVFLNTCSMILPLHLSVRSLTYEVFIPNCLSTLQFLVQM